MTTLLECTGAAVGRLQLPPFQVGAGEFVCLHVPEATVAEGYELPRYLTGQRPLPGLQVRGRAEFAEPPLPRPGLFGLLRNPRVRSWLVTHGVSGEQAERLPERYKVPPGMRIGTIGWTERSLLALEAALLTPAALIVFTTAGLDPNGIEQVYRLVQAVNVGGRAFAHVSFAGIPERGCSAGARCLALSVSAAPTPTDLAGAAPES